MKYDNKYFDGQYHFLSDNVEWNFLPKTEIKVFLKKWICGVWLVTVDMRTNNLVAHSSLAESTTLSLLYNSYCMNAYGSQLCRLNNKWGGGGLQPPP